MDQENDNKSNQDAFKWGTVWTSLPWKERVTHLVRRIEWSTYQDKKGTRIKVKTSIKPTWRLKKAGCCLKAKSIISFSS